MIFGRNEEMYVSMSVCQIVRLSVYPLSPSIFPQPWSQPQLAPLVSTSHDPSIRAAEMMQFIFPFPFPFPFLLLFLLLSLRLEVLRAAIAMQPRT